MEKKLFTFFTLASAFVLCSGCIDNSYNLDELNTEMTLLPGITVPVDYSTKPSDLNSLLSDTEAEVKKDESGNYVIEGTSSKELQATVSSEKFEEAQPIAIEGYIDITFDKIPNYLKNLKPGSPLKAPAINFGISNPTGSEVILKCRITNGTKSEIINNIIVSPASGTQVIKVEDSKLDNLFIGSVPGKLTITDMSIKKLDSQTRSIISDRPVNASDFVFNIGAMCTLPITLKPGAGIIISYELLLTEADLKIFTDANADMTSFSAEGTVTSTFPLTISPEFVGTNVSGNSVGSASFLYTFNDAFVSAVQPGTEASPAITGVKAAVTLTDKIANVRKLSIKLNADNIGPEEVTLNDKQTLGFHVASLIADGGVTISF